MAGTEKVRQQEEVLGGSKSKFRHQWGKYKQTGGKESWACLLYTSDAADEVY